MLSKVLSRPLRPLSRAAASAFTTEAKGPAADADVEAAAPASISKMSVIAKHSIAQMNKDVDVNKFFELSDEQIKKNFPSGLPKRLNEMFEFLEPKKHLMLRKSTASILDAMTDFPQKWPAHWPEKAFVLDGERGTGKTVALIQAVNFARENGWIVLHVPHAREWVNDAPYVTKSAHIEGKFDIDVVGMDILKQLIECHGEQLATLSVRGDYGAHYYPRSFAKKPKSESEYDKSSLTLLDICENGLKDDLLTCKAVLDLKAELAQVTEFPVLIAIDEYNTWFRKTVFGYEGVDVKPEDITLIDALRDVDESGYRADRALKNGLFLAATTENFPSAHDFSKQATFKRVRKLLHPYTNDELKSLIDYFHEVNFRQSKYSDKDVVYLRLMSKSIPLKVFKQACLV
ncbi:Aste57867_9683 [Aphanomyces stellatus]|uniref:Small ribosomal subunit protein mS29 n=1 Tax=Aphanomyces stellatus TaxID=120398 RepID=A0A485KNI1_9STRA|nr:hypothetical protein As57867_009645 [Aphanomyces stellatus]VFT86562.1 Aste57867_9683 [Aphanomyces stellatus]